MSKIYFADEVEDGCYDLDYFREYMQDNGLSEMKLFEAKRETGRDYFYCRKDDDVYDNSGSCGRFCDGYKPLNHKSGRCVHYGFCYTYTDKVKILRIKLKDQP